MFTESAMDTNINTNSTIRFKFKFIVCPEYKIGQIQ